MMPLADILFLFIVVYLLYKFVYNFLLPVVRTTRHVREQFRNMQGNDAGSTTSGPGPSQPPFGADTSRRRPTTHKRTSGPPAEDYIDFEEIK